jgi:hypothetical protein
MTHRLTPKVRKQLLDLSKALKVLNRSSYAQEAARDRASDRAHEILDDWKQKGIGRWKRDVLFDHVERYTFSESPSRSDLYADAKRVLNE